MWKLDREGERGVESNINVHKLHSNLLATTTKKAAYVTLYIINTIVLIYQEENNVMNINNISKNVFIYYYTILQTKNTKP